MDDMIRIDNLLNNRSISPATRNEVNGVLNLEINGNKEECANKGTNQSTIDLTCDQEPEIQLVVPDRLNLHVQDFELLNECVMEDWKNMFDGDKIKFPLKHKLPCVPHNSFSKYAKIEDTGPTISLAPLSPSDCRLRSNVPASKVASDSHRKPVSALNLLPSSSCASYPRENLNFLHINHTITSSNANVGAQNQGDLMFVEEAGPINEAKVPNQELFPRELGLEKPIEIHNRDSNLKEGQSQSHDVNLVLSPLATVKAVSLVQSCPPTNVSFAINRPGPIYQPFTSFEMDKAVVAQFQNEFNHEDEYFERLRESPIGESPIFCQVLDMFPDIERNFLKSHCSIGLGLNDIVDIILEMNSNYPKENHVHPTRPDLQSDFTIKESINAKSNSSIQTFTYDVGIQKVPQTQEAYLEESSIPVGEQVVSYSPDNVNSTIKVERKNSSVLPAPSSSFSLLPTNKSSGLSISPVEMSVSQPTCESHDLKLVKKINENIEDDCSSFKNKPSTIKNGATTQNDQFNMLIELFPDGDQAFMEDKSKLSKREFENFIFEALETQNYPKAKKVELEKRDSEDADLGMYTSNFNVEQFLKIFPEPIKFFLDAQRNCICCLHGLSFLKRRYRHHAVKFIMQKYKECNYNLTKTCEDLDQECKPTRMTKRLLSEIQMPAKQNLPFIQEACFIEHRNEITSYLQNKEESKKLAYEQAELRGELIECNCCFYKVMFEDCVTCNDGDLFCKPCVTKYVEVRFGSDGMTSFPCLQACGSEFSLQLLQNLIDARLFSRLLQRVQLDEVRAADIDGLEICPFCEFATIPPPETNIFTCLNPECLKESCRKCHKVSHIPLRCEEVENDDQARARKYIEDEMTKALVRQCYKCHKSFIKMDGCNKMTCTCGAKMCYICRQPVVDYKHFNGPGGSEHKKCPLYSTDKVLHVDAVEAVAKKAVEEVKASNPELQLKHDPSKMLPEAKNVKNVLPPGMNEQPNRLIDNVLQWIRQDVENMRGAGMPLANRHHNLNVNIPLNPLGANPVPMNLVNHHRNERRQMRRQQRMVQQQMAQNLLHHVEMLQQQAAVLLQPPNQPVVNRQPPNLQQPPNHH